jgi:hypothetical protein
MALEEERISGFDEKKDEHGRPLTNDSSTDAELDEEVRHPAHNKETDAGGIPDIDHDEIEEAVPGHELDVELGKAS